MTQLNNPETADHIDEFLFKLEKYIVGDEDILPFTFIVDDPAGNSYIKNPFFPQPDPNLTIEKYSRTVEQLEMMGYRPENAEETVAKTEEQKNELVQTKFKKISEDGKKKEIEKMISELPSSQHHAKYSQKDAENMLKKATEINKDRHYTAHKVDFCRPLEDQDVDDQAIELDTACMNCQKIGKTRMCTCSIPYFKEIIVIAFTCDFCLHRETEVKTGGGISDKGKVYTIKVDKPEDLNRDLFKSETAEIEIPEIGCTVVSGSLGGILSTVEGVLEKVFFNNSRCLRLLRVTILSLETAQTLTTSLTTESSLKS